MVKVRGCWQGALGLLFPRCCHLCRQPLAAAAAVRLCPDCLAALPRLKPPWCSRCGCSLAPAPGDGHVCGTCLVRPPNYDQALSAFAYQEPLTGLLHALKYRGELTVLPLLAGVLAPFCQRLALAEEDLVLPVPLHIRRLRERGFNQSLLLARLLFPDQQEQIPARLLRRVRDTVPQTSLDGAARRRNLARAFALSDPDRVKGRRVLLVDDVLTTGTTVNECCKVLRAAGAARLEVVTVARVTVP